MQRELSILAGAGGIELAGVAAKGKTPVVLVYLSPEGHGNFPA